MRILHLSDTHLGAVLSARGADRGWSRASEHLASMETALAPALERRVDLVLHTGDLFDRSTPPPDAVAAAIVLLHRVARRVPVVLMPGNHDRKGLAGHLTEGPNLHIVDAPVRLVLGGLALGVVPYVREAPGWAEAARTATGPGVDLLLAHQSFHGARVPGFRFNAGHLPETVGEWQIPRGARWIASGHIHPRQVLRLGGATVVYTGSTERTSYSEQHETKGYTVWEFESAARWRFVDLPTRPMRWIIHPDQIQAVTPGTLVGLARDLRTVEHEEAVLERGGWLTGKPARAREARPRPAEVQQVSLFGEGG